MRWHGNGFMAGPSPWVSHSVPMPEQTAASNHGPAAFLWAVSAERGCTERDKKGF